MGTYKKGILGSFSGKVGTVVGSSWKGIEYMRSLPKPSTKAPTDLQLEQRIKFAIATGFLRPISSLVNLGYKSLAVNKTGYNLATAQVIAEAIIGVYPEFQIDYAKVLFSKGNLTGPWNAVSTSDSPAVVNISWTDNSGLGTAKETDKAVILVYNPDKAQFVFNTNSGAARSVLTDSMVVPPDFSGDTVQVWIAFLSEDKKTISTSIHTGTVVIA